MSAAMQCGFNEQVSGQIAMAVDEALCNIYRHGYKGDMHGRVKMDVSTSINPSTRIDIQIIDDADQVDIETIRSRDLEDVHPGGIGVHLIQTIMDDAQWSKRKEGGMQLTMSKQGEPHSSTKTTSKVEIHGG